MVSVLLYYRHLNFNRNFFTHLRINTFRYSNTSCLQHRLNLHNRLSLSTYSVVQLTAVLSRYLRVSVDRIQPYPLPYKRFFFLPATDGRIKYHKLIAASKRGWLLRGWNHSPKTWSYVTASCSSFSQHSNIPALFSQGAVPACSLRLLTITDVLFVLYWCSVHDVISITPKGLDACPLIHIPAWCRYRLANKAADNIFPECLFVLCSYAAICFVFMLSHLSVEQNPLYSVWWSTFIIHSWLILSKKPLMSKSTTNMNGLMQLRWSIVPVHRVHCDRIWK